MLGPFAAGPALFRSGWFVESLATQTLVVFVIRTHRVPFWRSRPSRPLLGRGARCHHHRRALALLAVRARPRLHRAPRRLLRRSRRHGRVVPLPRRAHETPVLRTRAPARSPATASPKFDANADSDAAPHAGSPPVTDSAIPIRAPQSDSTARRPRPGPHALTTTCPRVLIRRAAVGR